MAQGRERNNFVPRTCVSPLWKDSSSSNVITLRMRPTQTPFTSLDTFMAAHSPRRFCQARQKYILKPLTVDKRITDTVYAPVQQKTRNDSGDTSSNSVRLRQSHRQVTHRSPHSNICTTTDSSSEGEVNNQRVLALGKCKLDNEELVASDCSSDMYKGTFFRPGPKVPMTFNRSTSIPSMPRSTSDLIAIGTIPITSQRQTPVKPMSRSSSEEDIQLMPKTKTGGLWKTKATLNLKGCKYPDPMAGASPSFQARITEMAQLEVETIRFEKTKKTRKKASSS
ncbi:uncharacterized protein LOC144645190 isoform X1 [Oculina patagonica]